MTIAMLLTTIKPNHQYIHKHSGAIADVHIVTSFMPVPNGANITSIHTDTATDNTWLFSNGKTYWALKQDSNCVPLPSQVLYSDKTGDWWMLDYDAFVVQFEVMPPF